MSKIAGLPDKKEIMRKFCYHLPIIIALLGSGCERNDEAILKLPCIKGKYLGKYCEGVVIQILDDADIGKDWENMYTNQLYSNAVVASLDSLLTESGYSPD